MSDQPDDHGTGSGTASRKRPISPGALASPASPAAESKNKRTKLPDEAREPTSSPTTNKSTANNGNQKSDASEAVEEDAPAPGPGSPDEKDTAATAAAPASEVPVENDPSSDYATVATAMDRLAAAPAAAAAREATTVADDEAVPASLEPARDAGVDDFPLSPGEVAELQAYYALDAEKRAEERARALAEYGDAYEDEEGGGPASSPAGGR